MAILCRFWIEESSRIVTGSHFGITLESVTLTSPNIDNTDPSTWERRTREEYLEHAEEWLQASSAKAREKIFKRYGVHWSELLRLPYWDPTNMVVVDAMHNLFLGILRHHFRSNPTPAQLKRNTTVPILRQLCFEKGVKLPEDVALKKDTLVSSLMELPTAEKLIRVNQHECDEVLASLDLEALCVDTNPDVGEDDSAPAFRAPVTLEGIKLIQKGIALGSRPSSHEPLPSNFGSSSHGKLKADLWCGGVEFDLPVALIADVWYAGDAEDAEDAKWRLAWSDNTMYGVLAVERATSRRTSPTCADKYLEFMQAYLDGLKSLFPEIPLLPNHHFALHLGEILKNLGPVQGWWVFPFERIVGILQQVNTNSRLGNGYL
ncbi:hypothetical protein JAAARDRAFT_50392 [Jaapia argillacea MUCL 33604]|uniref:Uncharacterized protein n=1 Tax=Jaapia argillacea MUCL 33604 TaxID=933084 RepID=A0A067PNZ8_9AGAM|nr:hypothetical protein JAAARDRAFT_50392 [Jaapia argillacea MUCL 33604]